MTFWDFWASHPWKGWVVVGLVFFLAMLVADAFHTIALKDLRKERNDEG